jgi:IMP dehydrogenase
MAHLIKQEFLTFDDVLMLPQLSRIETRETISLDSDFLGLKLSIPIISANMDYVTGPKMAIAMREAGGLGILHRFTDWNTQVVSMSTIHDAGAPVAFSVGVRDPEKVAEHAFAMQQKFGTIYLTVDVAHGHHTRVLALIEKLKRNSGIFVIAGNIATSQAYTSLSLAGADAIKVGIGPGSVCTTREVTGVGVPQLSALLNIDMVRRAQFNDTRKGPLVIADGGLKNSGDIVKALAAGADAVMLGNLLAGASETPGETFESPDGRKWRPYRGQSIFGVNGLRYTPEGISGYVEDKGPVAGVLKRLVGGIRSGMSYVGAETLAELRETAVFIKVSEGTKLESQTRVREIYG